MNLESFNSNYWLSFEQKLLRATYCMDLWTCMDGPELLKLLDHLNGPDCTPYTEPWDDDGTEDAQKYEFWGYSQLVFF